MTYHSNDLTKLAQVLSVNLEFDPRPSACLTSLQNPMTLAGNSKLDSQTKNFRKTTYSPRKCQSQESNQSFLISKAVCSFLHTAPSCFTKNKDLCESLK